MRPANRIRCEAIIISCANGTTFHPLPLLFYSRLISGLNTSPPRQKGIGKKIILKQVQVLHDESDA